MKFINALEQAQWHIRTLWCLLIILLFFNVITIFGWMHSQSKIQIDIPPQIPESGLTITQGKIPKSTIYSFAFYIWQSVNHWSKSGMKDYKKQITKFQPFLTPKFKLKLIQDYNNLLNQGELRDRIRMIQGIDGSEYSPDDVIYMGHSTWIVHLKMHLVEMMNSNLKVVKDIQMHYTLKIVRYDVDAKKNPWGLALSDFSISSSRIKTTI